MATQDQVKAESEKQKADSEIQRTRSPNFPALSLRKAVERMEALHKAAKKFRLSAADALKHLGHTSTVSSNALQTIGALKAFGLIDTEGAGASRKIGVSDVGAKIALNHPDRAKMLKEIALEPAIFKEIWDMRTEDGLPPNEAIRNYLLFNRNFTESAIPTVIASFRDTIDFAQLSPNDKLKEELNGSSGEVIDGGLTQTPAAKLSFKIGDFVQWTSAGVDQFSEPRPIKGFHGPEHAYFLDGGGGIAPISELKKMGTVINNTPAFIPSPQAGNDHVMIVEERFTLDEGPVSIRWPGKLSAESVQDLEYQIKGLLARARRKAGIASTTVKNDGEK